MEGTCSKHTSLLQLPETVAITQTRVPEEGEHKPCAIKSSSLETSLLQSHTKLMGSLAIST
jgi:hypothetical protein